MIRELSKETINETLNGCKTGIDGLLALYKEVIPDWDKVQNVGQFPKLSKKTTDYVVNTILDIEPHRKAQVGMMWVNNGMGCDESLEDWKVEFSMDKIEYTDGL